MKKKFHYLVLLRNLKHLLKKKSDYNIKIIASDKEGKLIYIKII